LQIAVARQRHVHKAAQVAVVVLVEIKRCEVTVFNILIDKEFFCRVLTGA
jgi:hypothetical protein